MLTNLSKDVIRVWERRYGILKPLRGPNGYRMYTDEDIQLLRFLKSEMDKGASIGELAGLGRDELLQRSGNSERNLSPVESPLQQVLDELIGALLVFDAPTFERKLNGTVALLPFEEVLYGLLIPLQKRVGELWHSEAVGVETEHFVTRLVQQKIFTAMNQLGNSKGSPRIVVGCPPGEDHDIGAQSVAYWCKRKGYSVYYLGADVPVDSYSRMCSRVDADLTLLSFLMEPPRAGLNAIVDEMSEKVFPLCPVWSGGAGAEKIKDFLEDNRIEYIEDMGVLDRRLTRLSKKGFSNRR